MKKLLLLIVMLVCRLAYAQKTTNETKQITISGILSENTIKNLKGAPEIWYYDDFNPKLEFSAKVLPATLSGNTFTVNIIPKGNIGYFKFKGINQNLETLFTDILIVKSGESVCLHIDGPKNIYFTGNGASILNYQLWMGKQFHSDTAPFATCARNGIAYKQYIANDRLNIALDTLNKYRSAWGDTIYNILRINTASSIYLKLSASIANNRIYDTDSTYKKEVKEALYSQLIQQSAFPLTDAYLIERSFLYLEYLFYLNKAYFELSSGEHYPLPFNLIYQNIITHYSELLRDKLLTYGFLSLAAKQPKVLDYLPGAIDLVHDTSSKQILEKIGAKLPGTKVFDFAFEGLNGKPVIRDDFRGKVLIIDTWFNGCENCIGLTIQLKPIIEHYRNNKDVVFLSVNVDKSRKRFADGVKSGLYGAKSEVYAYTNGLGYFHPMLLYYDYWSFPNVLIVDKQGRIVSSDPPRGRDNQTKDEWIKLIDRCL